MLYAKSLVLTVPNLLLLCLVKISINSTLVSVCTHGCVSYLSCGIQMEDDSIDDSCLGQHPHGETSRVQAAINICGAGEVAGGEVERQGGLGFQHF